jgi:hypothetical protein
VHYPEFHPCYLSDLRDYLPASQPIDHLYEAWLRSVAVPVPTIANSAGAALEWRWNRLAASAPVNRSWPVSGVDAERGEDRENTDADAAE